MNLSQPNQTVRAWAVACCAAIAITTAVGCAAVRPGCGCGIAAGPSCGAGCILEPGCDVGCGCEPGCAIEPGCGCATTCGVDGCSMAGQMWCGDGSCGPRKPLINVCTGPACGVGCDPGCGCEPGCAIEPGCGCEPSCGVGGCGDACGVACGCGNCPVGETLIFGARAIGSEFRRLLAPLGLCCPCGSGCGGCGELYWNEWHSDPPACCDPCDQCGNWVGPSSAGVHATVEPSFSKRRVAKLPGGGPRLH